MAIDMRRTIMVRDFAVHEAWSAQLWEVLKARLKHRGEARGSVWRLIGLNGDAGDCHTFLRHCDSWSALCWG